MTSVFTFPIFVCLSILLFCLPAIGQETSSPPKRTVVVVPGILGSALSDPKGNLIWGDRWSFKHFDRLLIPNGPADPDDDLKPSGLIQTVQILGPWKANVYHKLRKTFQEDMGYTLGVDYFEFPYDWRQSNFTSAALLRKWVDQHLGERPFDIVAHSMGGLVSEIFIKQLDTKLQVRRFITMGTPFQGSVNSVAGIDEGWGTIPNWLLGGLQQFRLTALSFPSFYELLPDYPNCCILLKEGTRPASYNPRTEKGWEHFEWDVPEYQNSSAKKRISRVLKRAQELTNLLRKAMPPYLEQVSHIAGEHVDTKMKFFIEAKTKKITKYRHGNGDGTVLVTSAAKGVENINQSDVSFSKHVVIFDDDATIARLKRIFRPDIYNEPYDYASTQFAFRTSEGTAIPMQSMGLNLAPSVVSPGASFSVHVSLSSDKAKLPLESVPVKAGMIPENATQSTPISLGPPIIEGTRRLRRVIYQGEAKAPATATSVRVEVLAEGIHKPIVDYLLVIQPPHPQEEQ